MYTALFGKYFNQVFGKISSPKSSKSRRKKTHLLPDSGPSKKLNTGLKN